MDSLLGGWENFYVIVGTTAGGLTGLTFVVIALIRDASKVTPTGLGAFVTPTIVHFGGVLALAAFLSMPHQNRLSLSVGFGLAGVAGVIYCGFIAVGIRRQAVTYTPVLEDWLFNFIVPALVYALLLTAAVTIRLWPAATLFAVASAALVTLFVGIHNAWDIAVFMATRTPPAAPPPK
jgi:hypothetical protein